MKLADSRSLNWSDLRYFAALVRSGSLSGAARNLDVEHSTIARRIQALEGGLGLTLYDRRSGGWTLTHEGRLLAEQLSPLEEGVSAIDALARRLQESQRHIVRVTAPPPFAALYLMPRLKQIHDKHPDIDIELIGETRIASLARGEADIALRMVRPSGASTIARRLPDFRYGLFGHRDYIAKVAPNDWSLLGHDKSLEHTPPQRWLKRYAGNRPLSLRSNDMAALFAAVRAGTGVAVLACYMAAMASDLICLEQGHELLRQQLWLAVRADVDKVPAVRAIKDALLEIILADSELISGGDTRA